MADELRCLATYNALRCVKAKSHVGVHYADGSWKRLTFGVAWPDMEVGRTTSLVCR